MHFDLEPVLISEILDFMPSVVHFSARLNDDSVPRFHNLYPLINITKVYTRIKTGLNDFYVTG